MEKELRYRMYGLVPYNISPIQQGIQFGHGVVDYGMKYATAPEYLRWATIDKTFIILNGGTTNDKFDMKSGLPFGTLNQHALMLHNRGVRIQIFNEPDLGDQLTAVVFLVEERVWDKKMYPDLTDSVFDEDWTEGIEEKELNKILFLREFLSQFRLA
jgi:hypothetical protein